MVTASPRKRSDTSLRGMRISHVRLSNWRNFKEADVELQQRMFLVGPNASGKSNFLDVFRFLRDIVRSGGGFQQAVVDRGGVSKVRCLAARQHPEVVIEVTITDDETDETWIYQISFTQDNNSRPVIRTEQVTHNGENVLSRPNDEDKGDPARLSQTYLEQVNANADFRRLANYFERVLYLHLVPQMIRNPDGYDSARLNRDPYGRDFLERISSVPERTRNSRLAKVGEVLRFAVPQMEGLVLVRDQRGVPHLSATYKHWRPNAGQQNEDQFSDGTLRLIGLLWAMLEGDSLLLLEEPELSLHGSVVRLIPSMIHRMKTHNRRQVMISTHSADLLSDESIGAEDILILFPDKEGTKIIPASDLSDIRTLLEHGMPASEAVLPLTRPEDIGQLALLSL